MKASAGIVAVAGILAAGVGYAQSGAEVVKAKGCLNCHDVDKKMVAASFKDISAKYKDNKDAESNLIKALKDGNQQGLEHA